jgi:hypothetical protein
MAILKVLRRSRLPAQLLILTLLMGGLPTLSGIVVQPSEAAFTLDICHPLPGVDRSSTGISLFVPLPSRDFAPALADLGGADESYSLKASRPCEAPSPPPPKIGG